MQARFRAVLATAMTRPLALCLTVVVVFTLAAVPRPSRSQDAPRRTEAELRTLLAGTWYLAVPEAQGQSTIDRGIERAVVDMTYMLQGITRSQMHERTPLNRRIDIGFEPDGRITVVFDQRFTYTTRPSVQQRFDLPDGSVDVRQYFRDGHLEQYFEHSLGRRWNTYELDAAGTTMTVGATQQGPMMPTPMAFRLPYTQRR